MHCVNVCVVVSHSSSGQGDKSSWACAERPMHDPGLVEVSDGGRNFRARTDSEGNSDSPFGTRGKMQAGYLRRAEFSRDVRPVLATWGSRTAPAGGTVPGSPTDDFSGSRRYSKSQACSTSVNTCLCTACWGSPVRVLANALQYGAAAGSAGLSCEALTEIYHCLEGLCPEGYG